MFLQKRLTNTELCCFPGGEIEKVLLRHHTIIAQTRIWLLR